MIETPEFLEIKNVIEIQLIKDDPLIRFNFVLLEG